MGTIVTLQSVKDAGVKQQAITKLACQLLQTALNHPSFAQRVRAAKYTATWQAGPPGTHSAQRTPDQVLRGIQEGRESGTDADFEIDIAVQYQNLRRGVLGATDLGMLPIHTAYWFVNNCIAHSDAASLAAHFMHEWMHVSGFYHAGGNSARGDVAYVLGDIVADILREHLSPQAAELLEQ